MARAIKQLVAKVGTYRDRTTGEEKGRFQNIGTMMKNDDGSVFLLLDTTFNPAGVPDPQGRGNVLVNVWDMRDRNTPAGSGGGAGGGVSHDTTRPPIDDEIPF